MCIKKLNSNQISIVAGGYEQRQDIKQEIHRVIGVLTEGFQGFGNSELGRCVSISSTAYGITLCLPARKPLNCPYDLWGMLHDLPEEMPKC